MPGMNMNSKLSTTDPTVVSAFHAALIHQCLVVAAVLAAVLLAWNVIRAAAYRVAREEANRDASNSTAFRFEEIPKEPAARRLLRITFGLLWLLDGILQAQASMPLGLISGNIVPAANSSPGWVRHLVQAGATIWNDHPVTAASAVVWIQVGLGLFLLVAPRGRWSRFAGASSVAWGLVVWSFGESFGGILSPAPSFLFGAPGAVLFYCVAGVLLALPESYFERPALGKAVLAVFGGLLLVMAVVQAWPSNGFWRGHGGPLSAMGYSMSGMHQPSVTSSAVRAFASFDSRHAVVVNGVVVALLAVLGLLFVSGRRILSEVGVCVAAVFFLANWILVQDLGVVGGVGTDPNSMIPALLVVMAGVTALVRPASHEEPALVTTRHEGLFGALTTWAATRPSFLFRAVAACGAAVVVLVGAVPMAAASLDKGAAPIVSQAIDGPIAPINLPAPDLRLVDQHGGAVRLASLDDKVVVLTFLDPVCTSDCPLIAQEMHEADRALGAAAGRVVFVAVVANPIYRSIADVRTFDRVEGLSKVKNWLFLTGGLRALQRTWHDFGVEVSVEPDGAMVAHSDFLYVISHDTERYEVNSDPGPGTEATKASFSGVIDTAVQKLLSS